MFKELHEAAKRAPVILRIAPEGEGLRVMIHQKADELDAGEIPLALSVAGTPEQLDADLSTAVTTFLSTAANAAASIAEQAREQGIAAAASAVKPKKTGII